MVENNYILNQTNDLARKFYFALGHYVSGYVKFWESDDEVKRSCWEMASIAQSELVGIEADDFIPKKTAGNLSVSERINRAMTDGRRTAKKVK